MTDYTGKNSFLLTKGEPLVNSGFPVIPITRGLKFPKGLEGWQDTQATASDIQTWGNGKFKDGGVGILTGNIIGVDIDLFQEDIARKMTDWCLNHIGHAPIRVGCRPKTLLVYRTDKPFRKCISNQFRDEYDQLNRIEVLGVGQQFVAYAVHPDTQQPYEWSHGELDGMSPDQLGIITLDQIESMFGYFTLLVDEEWKQCGNQSIGRVVTYDVEGEGTAPWETTSDAVVPGSDNDGEVKMGSAVNNKTNPADSILTGQSKPAVTEAKVSPAKQQREQREKSAEELLTNAKAKLNLTVQQVRDTLNQLDSDESYELWVRVGMALYHQYEGEDQGLLLWDEWSKTGESYQKGEPQRKWASFHADTSTDPVTMASIVKLAGKIKVESSAGKLENFLSQFVYVVDGDRVCDLLLPPEVSMIKMQEFKNETHNELHLVPAPTEKDPKKEKWDQVWKAWLAHGDRLSARGTKYLPDGGRVIRDDRGVQYINEYSVPKWERVDSVASEGFKRVMEHFKYQLADDTERRWLLDWFAHVIQKPADRCMVTPLLIAKAHGTGRGWFGSLVRELVGSWNVSQSKFSDLTGERSNFNGFLNNTLVCEIGEVREGGKDKFAVNDKVRDVLTEKQLRVNNKFGTDKTQAVYTRFLMQSNHADALVIEEEDRRIQVLTGPNFPMDSDYYDSLYNVLSDKVALAELYWWFMRRDLSGFDFRRSSDTVGRRRMISLGKTDLDAMFDLFEQESEIVAGTRTLIEQGVLKMSGYSDFNKPYETRHFNAALKHRYQSYGVFNGGNNVVKVDGKSQRVLVKREISKEEVRIFLGELVTFVENVEVEEVEL